MSIDSNKPFVKRHFQRIARCICGYICGSRVVTALTCLALLIISGCAGTNNMAHQIAFESGFNKQLVSGELFDHVVYESKLQNIEGQTLRVYLEGDGIPWSQGKFPADDPTPRDPLALRLMAQDSNAAIYVGRPCYFGLNHSRNCSPGIWTSARYSEAVVASMNKVVRHYVQMLGVTRVILIGYSGGGAIATLMAARSSVSTFILTIAGNLNTDAWTTSKGFLPLDESLNPVDLIGELQSFPQLHLIAVNDRTVPPFVTRSYTAHLPSQFSRAYPDIDHSCCWLEIWPHILLESPWNS